MRDIRIVQTLRVQDPQIQRTRIMNRRIYILIVILSLAINSGCDEAKTGKLANVTPFASREDLKWHLSTKYDIKSKAIPGNYVDRPIEELTPLVFKGDIQAYTDLCRTWMGSPVDRFFFSFHMANTYDYAGAYFDVFNCLINIYGCDEWNVKKMNRRTQEIALEYLLNAAKRGHRQALQVISDYYPELMKEI